MTTLDLYILLALIITLIAVIHYLDRKDPHV